MVARYKQRTRRDRNEADLIKVFRDAGALVWLLDEPCDLLVGHCGQWCAVEVKVPYGPQGGASEDGQKLSEREAHFAGNCVANELEYACVRTPEEARAVLTRLGQKVTRKTRTRGKK